MQGGGGGHTPTHPKLEMGSGPADDGVDRRWAEPDGREAVLLCGDGAEQTIVLATRQKPRGGCKTRPGRDGQAGQGVKGEMSGVGGGRVVSGVVCLSLCSQGLSRPP